MSQIKKGAILNYLTIFLTNMVGLLLTPFIIRKLGDAEYGLYTLIGAFVGYISVLDLGLNNAVVRFVAKYRAEQNKEEERKFLGTTMRIYLIISTMVVVVGSILYYGFDSIFEHSLSQEEIHKGKLMFVILIFNLALGLPGGIFKGICLGYEEFVFPKSVNLVRYILRSILVVAILYLGGDALSLVILDTVLNLGIVILNALYVYKKLNIRLHFNSYNKALVRTIFNYSVWIFVFVLVGQFQWKAGQAVLGSLTDTKTVAIFAVGIMLGTYYGSFSTAISSLFLPKATRMTVKNAQGEELTSQMIKIGRISLMVLLFIFSAFIIFGKQFVLLWVGEQYIDSWIIALIIMGAYTLPLVQGFGNSILEAQNKMAFKAIVYLVFFSLGTLAGYFLAEKYKAIGMISGSVAGWMIGQLALNIYYHRVIGINLGRFFKELAHGILPVFILMLLAGTSLNMIPGQGWLNLGVKLTLFTLIYVCGMYFIGTIPSEKLIIRVSLSGIKQKVRFI